MDADLQMIKRSGTQCVVASHPTENILRRWHQGAHGPQGQMCGEARVLQHICCCVPFVE
jgi:hypothetical protein